MSEKILRVDQKWGLLFEAAKEGLGNGIPTISTGAHAWLKGVRLAEALPVITAIHATLVGVDKHRLCRLAARDNQTSN